MSDTQFDVVVFGATSFVGQILSRYLFERHGAVGGELRWAMAGRSAGKLEQVRAELGEGAEAIELITADAADGEALRAMCDRARVIVSTVGPYALYGSTLVGICAETGTDYCDLTGEVQWIRRMLDAHEPTAKANGARIVHCCGFDSIPSDLGVLYHQQQFAAEHGGAASRIRMRVKGMKGAMSGGTVASMMNITREVAADPKLRKALANPYLLVDGQAKKVRQPSVNFAEDDPKAGGWAAPFVMAGINTRIVHRSNALSGHAYGEGFVYDEAMATGRGNGGRMRAMGLAAGLAGFFTAAAIPPTRWVMERYVVPKPGEGPSPEAQRKGFFDLRFYGSDEQGHALVTRVTGDRDPGYGSTAKMLGEAAACLAELPKDKCEGGFWTPSTALGEPLIERLQAHAGLTFERVEG